MKPLKIRNENGETIEIRFNEDGAIWVRHLDINPKEWGKLQEYSKAMRVPSLQAFLVKEGIEDFNNPAVKEFSEKLGGYLVMSDGQTCLIARDEINAIHAAVKQAGGIIPNWSSRA